MTLVGAGLVAVIALGVISRRLAPGAARLLVGFSGVVWGFYALTQLLFLAGPPTGTLEAFIAGLMTALLGVSVLTSALVKRPRTTATAARRRTARSPQRRARW